MTSVTAASGNRPRPAANPLISRSAAGPGCYTIGNSVTGPSGGRRRQERKSFALSPDHPPVTGHCRTKVRVGVAHPAREACEDRRLDRAPRPLPRVPAGRGGGAPRAVRHDPAPDRPLARAARCHGLTGAMGQVEPGGESCAEVDQQGRAARIGPWTEVQRPFPAEISRRTCPQVDGGSSEEQGFGCRPSSI